MKRYVFVFPFPSCETYCDIHGMKELNLKFKVSKYSKIKGTRLGGTRLIGGQTIGN